MNHKWTLWLATAATLAAGTAQAADMELRAAATGDSIIIDGRPDAAWGKAEALTLEVNETPYKPSNGYDGISSAEVTLKALYDDTHVYFLAQWTDPTMSLERWPWVKQPDGSWKQMMKKDSTGHDNSYYEDKFSFAWNINQSGFQKKGCDASCHINEDGLVADIPDTSAGRHFTKPGQTIDLWHWKSARTNAVFQTDDQYINSDKKEQNQGWGRHGDHKTGGGYVNNHNEDKSAPKWMARVASADNRYWVLDTEKVPFVDTFEAGAIIGGVIAAPMEGSRGDLLSRGEWNDGVWTLEIKRKLVVTGEKSEEQDVQFRDLSKPYHFGVTVFDNSQINHIYHKKSIALRFD